MSLALMVLGVRGDNSSLHPFLAWLSSSPRWAVPSPSLRFSLLLLELTWNPMAEHGTHSYAEVLRLFRQRKYSPPNCFKAPQLLSNVESFLAILLFSSPSTPITSKEKLFWAIQLTITRKTWIHRKMRRWFPPRQTVVFNKPMSAAKQPWCCLFHKYS